MKTLREALSTSVASKFVVALTGLVLFGFLVTHLAANLLIYGGGTSFNAYGQAFANRKALLWGAEAFLLAALLVHMVKAVSLTLANRRARPAAYARKDRAYGPSRKSLASTSMIWTGAFLAAFVVLHIKTFKLGPSYPSPADPAVRDLQRLVLEIFANPVYAISYVVAMAVLGLHLRHGLASALQSLGIAHPRFSPLLLNAGIALAVAIALGFASIPIWVLLGGGRP